MRVVDLRCPGCGSPTSTDRVECQFCGRQLVVTSFSDLHTLGIDEVREYVRSYRAGLTGDPDNPELNSSIGMCFLKLSLYPEAVKHFEIAIEDDLRNSETYFYLGVALLEGKTAFLCPLAVIRRCEKYVQAAAKLEPRGVYYLMLAYIGASYYDRKFLNQEISSADYLETAWSNGLSPTDIRTFRDILGQSNLWLDI